MATFRSLTIQSGITTQIQDANTLGVGHGITTLAGDLQLSAFTSNIHILAGNSQIADAGAGAFDWSAATGTFKTSTGAVSLNGNTTVAAGQSLSAAAGAGNFDWSSSTGTFKTSSGAVTINGNTTFAAGVTVTAAAGAGSFDFSAATGAFKTSTGTVTIGGTTNPVNISGVGQLTTVLGNFQVNGTETIVGGTTFQGAVTFDEPGPVTFGSAGGAISVVLGAGGAGNQANVTAGNSATSFDLSASTTGAFKTTGGAVTIGPGAITVSGATTFASVAVTASGTSSFDLSGGSGIFKTSTGAVTIGPGAISVTGNTTFAGVAVTASGAASFDLSGGTGVFKTSQGAVTIGGFAAAVSVTSTAAAVTITAGAASSWTTSAGALTIDSAAALNLGNTTATSIHLGSGAGALTVASTSSTFNNNAIFSAGMQIAAGVSPGLDATAAGSLGIAGSLAANATSVNIGGNGTAGVGTTTAINIGNGPIGGPTGSTTTIYGKLVASISGAAANVTYTVAANAGNDAFAQGQAGTINNSGAPGPSAKKVDPTVAGNIRNVIGLAFAASGATAAATFAVDGPVTVPAAQWDGAAFPGAANTGSIVYVSTTTPGNLTLAPSFAVGTGALRVGILADGALGVVLVGSFSRVDL